jgi:hypothetical protein
MVQKKEEKELSLLMLIQENREESCLHFQFQSINISLYMMSTTFCIGKSSSKPNDSQCSYSSQANHLP